MNAHVRLGHGDSMIMTDRMPGRACFTLLSLPQASCYLAISLGIPVRTSRGPQDSSYMQYGQKGWSEGARLCHSWRICEVGCLAGTRTKLASMGTGFPAWKAGSLSSLALLRCGVVLGKLSESREQVGGSPAPTLPQSQWRGSIVIAPAAAG